MIKTLKINIAICWILLLSVLLIESCHNNDNNVLQGRDFRYFRIYFRGLKSNQVLRLDKDGSAYIISFNNDELSWDLLNNINLSNYNNIWIQKNDSIYLFNNFFEFKSINTNTDSSYFEIKRNQMNSYFDNKGVLKDSIFVVYYSLKQYKYQIDYFNFDSIKRMKGTDRYFDKTLKHAIKEKWYEFN
jgi:hypothetical protein